MKKHATFDVGDFGRQVVGLLRMHSLTSKFVCEEYGINSSTFSRMLNGLTGPDVQNYLRIKAFIDEWKDREPSSPEGRYMSALEREVGPKAVARLRKDIFPSPTKTGER